MAAIKLELSDCLADSPQTRALIGVFEQDADVLTNYARGLEYAFQRISYAQNELTAATQALAQHLREFDNQKFTLTTDNDYISSAMKELAAKIDQVSTFNVVLQTQLAENAAYSSSRFVEKYLMEFQKLKMQFQSNDKIHQETMKKSAKLSRRRTSESAWQEATDHLHAARKGFHGASMNYCAVLNLLQARKKTGLLDPLIGYIEAQMGFYKMGGEICQKELEEYLSKLNESLRDVEKATSESVKDNQAAIDRLDAESTRSYIPDPPPSMEFPELPVDTKKTQISGYLFTRSSGVFTNQWNQRYFFTQGGNLMQQGRDEVAGGLVMDLDGCAVGFAEADDRRYVFQINSQDGKTSVVLQAESKHSCMQWVYTINNISKGLYLANDPTKAAELMQAASKVPEDASPSTSEPPAPADTQPQASKSSRSSSQTTDFESKHESFKPAGMFAKLKSAASSLVAPLNKPEPEKPNQAAAGKSTSGDGDRVSRDTTDSELEAVINSTTGHPILFDLPPSASQGDDGVKPGETQQAKDEAGSSTRENPFTETSPGETKDSSENESSNDSNFRAMYVVRFIGCRQVEDEIHNGYAVISESIRSIMAARALHNIFSMNELHLVITDKVLKLVDPASQSSRDAFTIAEILMAANHRENTRLIGFIARRPATTPTAKDDVNMCYVFESNSDGVDVCCAIATAKVMVQSLIEQDELERQKELETDLEEQSKLLALSNVVDEPAAEGTEDAAKFEEEDLTMRDA